MAALLMAHQVPPPAYAIAVAIAWNWHRDLGGKVTVSQWLRTHPFAFLVAVSWWIPHTLRGSHLVDRIARLLARLRR